MAPTRTTSRAKVTRPTTVGAYLAAAPRDKRAALTKLRKTIKAAAPKAVEGMAYGLVGYKYGGKPLIYIGYAKGHCAVYGYSSFAHDNPALFAGYEMSKGTIRFPAERPLASALLRRMVRVRIAEIEAAG